MFSKDVLVEHPSAQGFDLWEVGMDNLVRLLKERVEVLVR